MRPVLVSVCAAAFTLGGLAAGGCGGDSSAGPTQPGTSTRDVTETATTAGTTPTSTLTLRVYFLRQGKVAAARRTVRRTQAVAAAALAALASGPNAAERAAGLATEVPAGGAFDDLRVEDGVASVIPPEGLSPAAKAQVVYTLTQFPTVRTVDLGDEELRRADLEAETPAIFLEAPVVGDAVSSPVRIRGTANTFEATFIVELLLNAAGARAFRQFVTATSGSGTRGTFDVAIPFSLMGSGPGTLVAYEESAASGRPIHRVEVPVTIRQ